MTGELTPISDSKLDGNAAAGLFSEVFTMDVTTARATCGSCGRIGSIGTLHLYAQEMGAVLRCPGCGGVVMRMARTGTHMWIDATGCRSIVIPLAPAS